MAPTLSPSHGGGEGLEATLGKFSPPPCGATQTGVAGSGYGLCARHVRAEAFTAALTRDLDHCAALERETMAILAELTALAAGSTQQAMTERLA